MSNQLGPLEICCDAPPYPIVQACIQIGIRAPEDVRWCRISQHRAGRGVYRQLMQFAPWNVFSGGTESDERPCNCGRPLPELGHYIFTLPSGREHCYYLGQCPNCHTVFWEEA